MRSWFFGPDTSPLLQEAIAHFDRGQYDAAIQCYEKAAALDPKQYLPHHYRGLAFEAKQDFEKAIAAFSKAIEVYPRSHESFAGRGRARHSLIKIEEKAKSPGMKSLIADFPGLLSGPDYDSAIRDYTSAIDISPRSAEYYLGRGSVRITKWGHLAELSDLSQSPNAFTEFFDRRRQWDLAIKDFEQARQFGASLAPSFRASVEITIGLAHHAKHECDQAIEAYNKALAFEPNNGLIYHNRGIARQESGDPAGAQSDYARAKALGFAH